MSARTCRNIKKKSTVNSPPSRKLLAADAVSLHLDGLGAPWAVCEDGMLCASWKFRRFADVESVVRNVMTLSERCDHHPRVTFGYRELSVCYVTHSAGGLSELDFYCAAEVSEYASARMAAGE